MMRTLLLLLALVPASLAQLQMHRPDPAEIAERVKQLEAAVAAQPADLASREELIGRYRYLQFQPESSISGEAAGQRIQELLLEMIRLDPARLPTGQASRSVTWRDPAYPAIRAAWLDAARKANSEAVNLAAATALSPQMDHQEILRLLSKADHVSIHALRAGALVAAAVYGDPEQSARAQTELSLLQDAGAQRIAGAELLGHYMRLYPEPAIKTEDLQQIRRLGNELMRKAGPALGPSGGPPAGMPKRIMVGGNVQERMLVRHVEPEYPAEARQARLSGVVRFSAVISNDGKVQNLQLLSGHPMLIPSATNAVRQWEFKPTLLNGQPVEVATHLEVRFELPR
jgi:TonB family protein